VLLDAFWVALEGLVHLIDSEDELGGENILGHQVRELEGQVQAVVVEEPDRVLFHRELGDDSFKLGTDSWDMLAQEKVKVLEEAVGERILVLLTLNFEQHRH
jgi:hypothetical protein